MPDLEDWFSDPEPLDEDDPEVQEESFELNKAMGLKPEDLRTVTQEQRDKYAAWLKEH
jgi:hypothetical protein